MKGVNKVILVGNICFPPEPRQTTGGHSVLNLRLACTESRKDGTAWKDFTEYVSVVLWNADATYAAQYAEKGSQLYVEGRLQTRSWEKDGAKQYKTEVNATKVLILGGPRGKKQDDDGPSEDLPY